MYADASQVLSTFQPDGDDWIVSLRFKDGTVETRRLTPGRITERQALSFAINASGRLVEEVEDATLMRAGAQTRAVQEASTADFERLVQRTLNR
jgi:hypothetical protein